MSIENSVRLTGNLGNDPDTKYTQGGMAITTLSLATTSRRKDKDGNRQEYTEWHRVKMFGKIGEIAAEYLKKGSKVQIEGSIRYGKYTDNNGVERYTTDIVADEMLMLDKKPDNGERHEPRREAPTRDQRPDPLPQERYDNFKDDFADDDIPFN